MYLAPGGRHLKVVADGGEKRLRVTEEPPENHCRPSVDTLFRSAANGFPGKAAAVILTGNGPSPKDGGASGIECIAVGIAPELSDEP